MREYSTILQAASPTLEQGRAFARYLDQAAEGFFRLWLGPPSVEIIARAFLEADHDLSHRNVTFAVQEDAIVGMVSGFPAERHRSAERALRRAAGGWNLRMIVVSTLFAPLLRVLDTVPAGDFYLQAVAVDPGLRGAGVGSLLIDWIEERARANGSTRIVLDVAGGNRGAQRLYERRGMTVESKWPRRIPLPGMKLLRMTKQLAPGAIP